MLAKFSCLLFTAGGPGNYKRSTSDDSLVGSLQTLRNAITEKLADILHEHPEEVNIVLRNSGGFGAISAGGVDLPALTQHLRAITNRYLNERNVGEMLKGLSKNRKAAGGKNLNKSIKFHIIT